MTILTWVPGQDWISWGIGLVGIISAAFFYWRSTIGARLVYQTRGQHLIGQPKGLLPREVTISFHGTAVPRLTSTQVVLWNAGRATIRGGDIVESDPLRVVFPQETRVLRQRVTSTTRRVVHLRGSVTDDAPHHLLVTFDFLDPGDGAVLELLHTGEKRHPSVKGTIMGMPRGIEDLGRITHPRGRVRNFMGVKISAKILYVVLLVLGVASLLLAFAPSSHPWAQRLLSPVHTERSSRWVTGGIGALYITTAAVFLSGVRRRFPRKLRVEEMG